MPSPQELCALNARFVPDGNHHSSSRIVIVNNSKKNNPHAPQNYGTPPTTLRRTVERSPISHTLHRSSSSSSVVPGSHLGKQLKLAIQLSLLLNILLTLAKVYASIVSGSLAVLSSLVDSIIDLTTQALFWCTDKYMHTPSVNYPAGRRRLEPIAVIISATFMGMAALSVVQQSVHALATSGEARARVDAGTVVILFIAVLCKCVLWWRCARLARVSATAATLAQDHRNDVLSNTVAIVTSTWAHVAPHWWVLDPVGAIVISMYITASWVVTGKEQVERLVGIQAHASFIELVKDMADAHHVLMKSDIVRAYHFGNHFLVEIEVILPHDMVVMDAHDISLALQKKVEALDEVERAFVHVDYLPRNYDEHKDLTQRLALDFES